MPYIKQKDRGFLDVVLDKFPVLTEGELNYVCTKLAHKFVRDHSLCYKTLNAVVGVLNCCVAEFIRMVISPYEDKKIQENDCVSELDDRKTLEDVR